MLKSNKLILKNTQSLGDITMLCYALNSLHRSYKNKYVTDVITPFPDLFLNNPFITKLDKNDPEVNLLEIGYPTIHMSNEYPVSFTTAFTTELSRLIGFPIFPTRYRDCIFLSKEEQSAPSPVFNFLNREVPYWVIAPGHKTDYTCKTWSFKRWQELIDSHSDVWFVQIGLNTKGHVQPELKGKNLINLVNQTSVRQLINLIYNSYGVIGLVSAPMHLSYAVPPNPKFGRLLRGNIVIAGGRESQNWEIGPSTQFLHTLGMLSCCAHGGCWKSRVVPLNDGEEQHDKSLCRMPLQMTDGQHIPKCMDLISVEDVSRKLDIYMSQLEYEPRF